MNGEVLRLVDSIARAKSIDREIVFEGIEGALLSAARKQYGPTAEIEARIDREDGQMVIQIDGVDMNPRDLGRIAAQAAKQVMIQKNREAERTSIYDEFSARKGVITSGQVTRIENGNLIVSLSRAEGFLPRSEQIPGEAIHETERIRALILDVRESGNQVKIILSRTHADFIRRLFELEVPEVADRIIEVKGIVREPGQRTKIAVTSIDSRVDAVGACVGVRGSRIKNIVEELGGEKIDIVRFNESSQVFIANSLRPAEVEDVHLTHDIGRATVIVPEDQLSLAIGKRGQNVRLAARLTGWDIDIMMASEFDQQRANAVQVLAEVPGVSGELAETIANAGFVSLSDVADIDPAILTHIEGIDDELAESIVTFALTYVREVEAARARAEAEPPPAESEDAPAEEAVADDEAAPADDADAETESGEEDATAEKDEGTVDQADAEADEEAPAADAASEEADVAGEPPVAEEDVEDDEPAAQEDTDEPAGLQAADDDADEPEKI
jgi:transcription termination/antitermination protein NusA